MDSFHIPYAVFNDRNPLLHQINDHHRIQVEYPHGEIQPMDNNNNGTNYNCCRCLPNYRREIYWTLFVIVLELEVLLFFYYSTLNG